MTHRRTPDQPNPIDTPTPWSWDLTACAIWLFLPVLFVQRFHLAPYDFIIVALAGYFGAISLYQSTKKKASGTWKLSNNRGIYFSLSTIIFAGLLSSFNAYSIALCGFELATFIYLLVMAFVIDIFAGRNARRFLLIGAVTSAVLCGVMGFFALLSNLSIYTQKELYLTYKGVTSNKFRGVMYTPNQWSGYVLTILPLSFALLFDSIKKRWRVLILISCLLGIFSVPATSSRSGLVLIAAEFFGFCALFILTNTKTHPAKKLLFIVSSALVSLFVFSAVSFLSDVWVFKRSLTGFDLVARGEVADSWRTINWNWALTEYAKHPFLGIGFGNFEILYDRHEVHSSYLSLLTEGGPLALLGYCAMFITTLARLVYTLLAQSTKRLSNIYTIGLIISLVGVLSYSVTHSTIRNRHVIVVCIVSLLYTDYVLLTIRAKQRQIRVANASRRARLKAYSPYSKSSPRAI